MTSATTSRASRDMNQAIKINPNFSTAFVDRGISNYDRNDYDRTIAAADSLIKPKPDYAVSLSGRGNAYENRRWGDRIIQEASQPIRNNQYNAYAYSPETFPAVSPPVAAPRPAVPPVAAMPASAVNPAPVSKPAPVTEAEPQSIPLPQPCPLRRKPMQIQPAQLKPPPRQVMNGREPGRKPNSPF